ncbi:sigma factor-like helix-turn-helix DNA-binding protein [Shewanella pealeana]|uniref:Sigma-70 region 4 domain protein n=1 Tax=Shewanella pealeana (strain ATCC 700345 / ANG-SQ1) TaxID=398579 RepID=A8H4Z2_SHEPA|nr:sigma factor-like helix-turn-helix DNA-binding protein [Shewanella pealeana]ABV87629.1 sigma-70 region 4 domain protein [Shewanella pealeana ATCC 700345]
MASLKLYFALYHEIEAPKISVYRDLISIHEAWKALNGSESYTGLIHVGFVRPNIVDADKLLAFKGKVLSTAAAKWALPSNYQSSGGSIVEVSLSNNKVPIYLMLDGFGYLEHDCSSKGADCTVVEDNVGSLHSTALNYLNEMKSAKSKEDIFAYIVENNLASFPVNKPVTVLENELEKYCQTSLAEKQLFGKTTEGKYYSVNAFTGEVSGWVRLAKVNDVKLFDDLYSHGVYDDVSYINRYSQLPATLKETSGIGRFNLLKAEISSTELMPLIAILPFSLLEKPLEELNLPVRLFNVFNVNGFTSLNDLKDITDKTMLSWPNFGRKSARDLYSLLLEIISRKQSKLDAFLNSDASQNFHKPITAEPFGKMDFTAQSNNEFKYNLASNIPLKEHFTQALSLLKDREKEIIELRMGFHGHILTLEEVGTKFGVTRERIRQIQKKHVARIIDTEYWDDCIYFKIDKLLTNRTEPLYMELLETEDDWFAGYIGKFKHLAAIIETFTEGKLSIINVNGANIIGRIRQEAWDNLIFQLRINLIEKSKEGTWTLSEIKTTLKSAVTENNCTELYFLLFDHFESAMIFNGIENNSKLIAIGKSRESAVLAVLQQAEAPLHFTEIAKRASKIFGKEVDVRTAHNSVASVGGRLFSRGTYGLKHFNTLPNDLCEQIKIVCENLLLKNELLKQWHITEILNSLLNNFPSLSNKLDHYILNIILEDSSKITYLNKNVWTRSDSNQTPKDRIDMADAFTRILEDAGTPLKGNEIKRRLEKLRGVHEHLQIQGTARMIQIGPDYWGLIDRDVPGTKDDNKRLLDVIFAHLNKQQIGIHASEVEAILGTKSPNGYTVLNLAQRDSRFYLAKSLLLGLAEWGEDTRRLNTSQAVRKLLHEMVRPMSINEINLKVEELTGLEVDYTVSGKLISEGAIYDPIHRLWYK